jgi:class 3 adenylate cyclase
MLNLLAPSRASDAAYRDLYARFEKLTISPSQSAILGRLGCEYDVRHVLGSISAPTLVLHRKGDRFVPIAHARYVAEHIDGARLVEVEGDDHALQCGDVDLLIDEIEEFITGQRAARTANRVLATVLFTDIVGSTGMAEQFGDQRWRQVLDDHDRAATRQLERFEGRLVKTTGDGLMAVFDSPTRAVLCAAAIRDAVKVLGLDIRAGVHTGEVERRGEDLGGIGVHIAARIAAEAGAGEVWVSRTVRDLAAGSGIEFESMGPHVLKGVADGWDLCRVVG